MRQQNIAELLKAYDIKPSHQRIKIYEYLNTRKNHPTVDQIYREMVEEIPTLSKTTVYNTLNLFVKNKLVQQLNIEEHEARYDADTSTHGHFKCKICGWVYDFNIDISQLALNTLSDFQVDERHLYLKGICKHCLGK